MNLIDKDNAEPLGGWANDSGDNKDEIILANILKRKSTLGSLPPLQDLKLRNSSQKDLQTHFKL